MYAVCFLYFVFILASTYFVYNRTGRCHGIFILHVTLTLSVTSTGQVYTSRQFCTCFTLDTQYLHRIKLLCELFFKFENDVTMPYIPAHLK